MIEHLPKEQMLQYFEELCIQNIKTNHNQDSAIDFSQNHQCLESTVEAAAVISPPEGPAKSDREAATPDILMEPVEPFGMVLTFSEDEPEENKKEEEIQREAHIDPPKEENMCEQEEALNTKQVQILPQHHRMLNHTPKMCKVRLRVFGFRVRVKSWVNEL